ncbi:hypothetical protein BDN72DRAFT_831768 [Pluteus cervinus]|uniref:Uncharacterized protein n=1 Tax=Pluteus cervinus TaxID=181527 RepID=A0ACD3BCF2_9AGAR|nr:hypothetical protein BDN72DRAFT_831768 [Pluteus cervinus]
MLAAVWWAFVPLLVALSAQAQLASQWCDSLTSICFQRFYFETLDTGFGYLFPSPPTNEFIGIFTAPTSAGWVGSSLGGGMTNNPLLVGWVNNGRATISARLTSIYTSPAVYNGPILTILGTSGQNATHQRIVFRCQNCTTWTNGGLPTTGNTQIGWATHGSLKPNDPGSAGSSVPQHSAAGQHSLSLAAAQSSSYQAYLQQLLTAPTLTPPTTPSTTTQSPAPTGPVSCPNAPRPSYSVIPAAGFQVTPILGRLSTPRGIALDSRGNLLIIQRGLGLTGHAIDANGCTTSSKTIITDTTLNHGIDVYGTKLYASSADIAWSWDYDAATMTVSNKKTLVTGMTNVGHNTRTLWVSRKNSNLLVVSDGSNGNIDTASAQASTGRAIVKVFDVTTLPANGVNYASGGKVLGYGLRNDVGVTEDRAGNIFTVENSMDDGFRTVNGTRRDVHNDNPAELLYNLGDPANPSGNFHGYPYCFKVWEPRNFTDKTFQVGDWFVQAPNNTINDTYCTTNIRGDPLTLLPPHTAPLDIKFGIGSDTSAYVSLHGSWNRSPPQGYKVVAVAGSFSASGAWTPNAPLSSRTAFTDILRNVNENSCTAGCFRPVGLAWSSSGENLYVSSDTTGEIFLLKKGASGPVTPPPTLPPTLPPTQPPTQPPTTRPTPSPTTPAGPQQTHWGQCGGEGWAGPTACQPPYTCQAQNQWYAQCL